MTPAPHVAETGAVQRFLQHEHRHARLPGKVVAVNDDPVRAQRAKMARLAVAGKRVGYTLMLAAIVGFVFGAATEFTALLTTLVTVCLLATTVTLAPAIVLAYAVKKAEREDPVRPNR